MTYRPVTFILLTLFPILTSCSLSTTISPSTQVSPHPAPEIAIIQLNTPLRFLTPDGLPADVLPGIYRMTTSSNGILHLTSATTGEVQNLHATTITHTEPLMVPYPLLLEEGEREGHIHLVLLSPDGQGVDAEGQPINIQSIGTGNLTQSVLTPTRRYTGVLIQQGRVITDTDWNEQEAVSSFTGDTPHSNRVSTSGQVRLEHGRLTFDSDARQPLLKKCRACAKKP
jgi:hypothetical protein